MSGLSRRQFLKRSGLATGGAALGGVVSLGLDPTPLRAATVPLEWKIRNTRAVPSVCPYCAVGCSILLHERDGKLINLEGNPDSPINRGTLCPKGAASFQLTVNPERPTRCLHRKPGGTAWEEIDLDQAVEMVAQRVKATRDRTFRYQAAIPNRNDGGGAGPGNQGVAGQPAPATRDVVVNNTLGIASLGGATMDNEWNYVQAKMWRGLGGVFLENQARI
jgi:formate dehydrogenase major subunit